MTSYSETFSFVYAVTDHNGTLAIQDWHHPVAADVKVTDDDALLTKHDQFTVHPKISSDHDLTFVSRAVTADGVQGFIAKDAQGHEFFFAQDQVNSAHQTLREENGPEHLCFIAGTHIKTPSGDMLIEDLMSGDIVLTTRGVGAVRWIGRQAVTRMFLSEVQLPVCVKQGAFGHGLPARDLYVSPDHALYFDGCLIQAAALINGSSIIRWRDAPAAFSYYHVELFQHELIYAEDTPVETFIENASCRIFDNWEDRELLPTPNMPAAELPYPRVKAYRQLPAATRNKLANIGHHQRSWPDVAA